MIENFGQKLIDFGYDLKPHSFDRNAIAKKKHFHSDGYVACLSWWNRCLYESWIKQRIPSTNQQQAQQNIGNQASKIGVGSPDGVICCVL